MKPLLSPEIHLKICSVKNIELEQNKKYNNNFSAQQFFLSVSIFTVVANFVTNVVFIFANDLPKAHFQNVPIWVVISEESIGPQFHNIKTVCLGVVSITSN